MEQDFVEEISMLKQVQGLVKVESKSIAKKRFEDLGLDKWLIGILSALGITEPTEIQQACIPEILKKKDVIGSAKTGSGKTATFALPILQSLAHDPYGIFALILTPTRELAFQIAEQFRILGSKIHLKLSVIVGGMDMMTQSIELSQRPHIVIATPGRLADHIQSNHSLTLGFKRLSFLVLDEADRMLDDTFAQDLQIIFNELPKKKQTLLFSATMTQDIQALEFSERKPFVYQAHERFHSMEQLSQFYLFIPSTVRETYLAYLLLNDFKDKSMILFTGKCKTAEHMRRMLHELGIRSTALHGQMSQQERLNALAKFKSGIVPILISTDVGSRGLDIPKVEIVLNYEVPANPADYIHRIGRTARAGRGGMSLSFVTEKDIDIILNIEQQLDKKLQEFTVSENKVLDLLNKVALAKRTASMQLMETHFGEKKRIHQVKKRLKKS